MAEPVKRSMTTNKSGRLGIIARADLTGLGVQSRNWVRLLNPHKIIVINSKPFNKNEQNFDWYAGRRNAFRVDGFIKQHEINAILNDIDILLTFEVPYSYELLRVARNRGIKTIIQNNWEFTDYLQNPTLPLPDLLVNHSYWHLDEQKQKWPQITEYCATPVFIEDYDNIMLHNMDRNEERRRYLHIAGRHTYEDRNGTKDLLAAMKLIPKGIYDFDLVIKTQTSHVDEIDDDRVIIDTTMPVDEKELYRDFDAVIMPRKYGGACLPMTEALAAGLPVIMTDVEPNNKVLLNEWLVEANKVGSFMARTEIDINQVNHKALASKIIEFDNLPMADVTGHKIRAREIAVKEYSSEAIKEKWDLLMLKLGV